MNEKEKKNLIIISSVFIFILVFMVFFTFYRRDAMLSDRTIPKINTEIDPPSHGDCNSSCSNSCKSASPGTSQYNYCYTQCMSSCSNPTPAPSSGGSDPEPVVTAAPPTAAPPTAAPPTAAPSVNCCVNGNDYRTNVSSSYCSSLGGTVVTSESQCKPKITCYEFANNSCTEKTITGTSCNSSSNYYSTWYDCRNNISCNANQYRYGSSCMSCASGKSLAYSGCQGNAEMCCVDSVSETKKCYRLLNGTCSEVIIGGNTCGTSGNYFNTAAECQAKKESSGSSSSTPSGTKCCCNFMTGHCATASACVGSLPSEQSQISSIASCNALDSGMGSGCFKDALGHYVWGAYGNDVRYSYTVALDKAACESKNSSGSSSQVDCTLRCPSTTVNVGESIMCTFESSDGTSLISSQDAGSGRYVKVTSDTVGNVTVTGSSSTCTSNAVTVSIVDRSAPKDCTVKSVTIAQNLVSVNDDGYSHNSAYQAVAVIEGSGCPTSTAIASVDGGTVSPSSVGLPSISNSIKFTVYPSSPCASSTITVSVGSSSKQASISTSTDWHPDEITADGEGKGCWKPSGSYYNTFYQADLNGADTYYSNYDNENDCFLIKWTRGCGPDGGSSSSNPAPDVTPEPTPAPVYSCYANAIDLINATSTIWATGGSNIHPYLISGKTQAECKAYACFVNKNKTDYKWANTTPSGYTKVPDILSRSECKPEEDACYIDQNGAYSWGKHKNDPNYTYVASITDSTKCKVVPNAACYSNGDDYVWDVTPPGGDYQKVPEMDTSSKCKREKFGCFYHDKKYIWGDYYNKVGYSYVAGITEQEFCLNVGCYVNDKKEYVWGDYSDDENYKLVPNIIDRVKCGVTPYVPKTDMNVQTIVYIAVAVMSVAGIYFVVRYNNKSKKI